MSKAEETLKKHADNGPLVYSHNQVIKAMGEMIEADREKIKDKYSPITTDDSLNAICAAFIKAIDETPIELT